jgi:hypothetical protein
MKFVAYRFGGCIDLILCVLWMYLFGCVDGKARLRTPPNMGTGCSSDCASMIRLVSPLAKSHCAEERRLVHGTHPKVIFIF